MNMLKSLLLAILVAYGVGKGQLGMIIAFCRTGQVKVEPLDAIFNPSPVGLTQRQGVQ